MAPEKAEVGRFPDVGEPHTLLAAGVAAGSPPGRGTPRLHNPPDTALSPIVPPSCYDQCATSRDLLPAENKAIWHPPERISEILRREGTLASI